MNSLPRALRSSTLTTAAAAALLALTGPAALAADDAEVEVTHECTSIDVSSTLDISNVVLEFADGDTQRFEDLPGRRTGTFAGTGDDSGEVITTAWIKSGDNKSGDGPGYGERFDFDATACENDAVADDDTTDSDDTSDSDAGAGVQSDDQQTPPAEVLSAGLERDADSGMQAADASQVRGAQQLPNTGAETPAGLAVALAALALGGGLLRRTSHTSA